MDPWASCKASDFQQKKRIKIGKDCLAVGSVNTTGKGGLGPVPGMLIRGSRLGEPEPDKHH